jgi:hypothetical protein
MPGTPQCPMALNPNYGHDIFHKDGTPYKADETELIKKLTGREIDFRCADFRCADFIFERFKIS